LKGRAGFVGNASGTNTSIAIITQRDNDALRRDLQVSKLSIPAKEIE
jgi:hypothetical protein